MGFHSSHASASFLLVRFRACICNDMFLNSFSFSFFGGAKGWGEFDCVLNAVK